MFSISEQISAVTKSTLANPFAIFNALSKSAIGGIEKIIALNINTAKQSFESSTTAARSLFSTTQAQELFSLQTIKAQPQIEKFVAYGRELAEISSQTGNEILLSLTNSVELVSSTSSPITAKSVVSTPVAKLEKNVSVKADLKSNTQLALLAEPEVTVAKNVLPKRKEKPLVDKTNIMHSPAENKTAKVSTTAGKKVTVKKAGELKIIDATPASKSLSKKVNKEAAKPATKALAEKSVAATPEIIKTTETVTTTESPIEKKSAVKMPFPASPIKKAAKPSFPTVSTRPVYKAKGSAATGAKKPVRQ